MKLILINGPAGVGKSTISARLNRDTPNSVLIDIDALRRSIPNYKERRRESLLLAYERTRNAIAEHLEKGQAVIIDKAISFSDVLDLFIETGREHNADVIEVILFAQKDILQKRADKRGYKPKSLLTRERVGELWNEFDDLRQKRPLAVFIDTSELTIDEVYGKVKGVTS